MKLNPFSKKNLFIAIFIDEAGRVFRTKKNYSNNQFRMKAKGGEQTYIIDSTCVFHDPVEQLPVSFYYAGNPLPLKLKHTKDVQLKASGTVDANTLTKVMDDKVVSDLFKPSNELDIKIIMYMCIFICFSMAWLIYRSLYGGG